MALTLKTVLQKTVKAASVTLTTPADRIGLGTVGLASNPANVLSPYPTSERMSGPWPEPAAMALSPVQAPAVRVGVLPVPGTSARPHGSLGNASWRLLSKRGSGTDFPGSDRSRHRFDGDCQSPRRIDDATLPHARPRGPAREVLPATATQK